MLKINCLTTIIQNILNALSVNFTKWSNTLKQFARNLPTNCLSVFDYFVELVLKGLTCSTFNLIGTAVSSLQK